MSASWGGTSLTTWGAISGAVVDFQSGMMMPVLETVKLARALGETAKYHGLEGADQTLQLIFLHLSTAQVSTLATNFANLITPVGKTPSSGTLVVQGFPNANHCILTSCSYTTELSVDGVGVNGSGTLGWDVTYDLVFRQLRR